MKDMKTITINGQQFKLRDAGAVRYDEDSQLSKDEQARARKNIGVEDSPIHYIESASDNPVVIRSLETGTYILKGIFKYFEAHTKKVAFNTERYILIERFDDRSELQCLIPGGNRLNYMVITDTGYTVDAIQLSELERTANRVTVIDENADDEHYPTAKAVYDYVDQNGGYDPNREYSAYFNITTDGTVSLKSEYQNGGSNNTELPEKLIIPDIINGIAVTALAPDMFQNNLAIKSLTIPSHITVLPDKFCSLAFNFEELNGTENIEIIGTAAFQRTSLKRAEFPRLKTLSGNATFVYCPFLEYADIGNVTVLPTACFFGCEKLVTVCGGENIKSIPQQGFMYCGNLKNVSFLKNVTSVGVLGMFRCGLRHNWHKHYGCSYGAFATPAQWNPTDIWSECTYVPCCTALRSTFYQGDSSWWDMTGLTEKQIKWLTDGNCTPTSAAMLYSAITGEDLTSPVDFANKFLPNLTNLGHKYADAQRWFEALGFAATIGKYSAANIQSLYDALKDGDLAIIGVLGSASASDLPTYNSHAVLAHGITENGELMICDPSGFSDDVGKPYAQTYTIPIQNVMMVEDVMENDFVIVRRKEE